MCPACLASAALVAGSVTTTGGLTALAVKIFRSRKDTPSPVANTTNSDSKEKEKAS